MKLLRDLLSQLPALEVLSLNYSYMNGDQVASILGSFMNLKYPSKLKTLNLVGNMFDTPEAAK